MSAWGIDFFVLLAGGAIGALGLAWLCAMGLMCLCALDYWADREKRKDNRA